MSSPRDGFIASIETADSAQTGPDAQGRFEATCDGDLITVLYPSLKHKFRLCLRRVAKNKYVPNG